MFRKSGEFNKKATGAKTAVFFVSTLLFIFLSFLASVHFNNSNFIAKAENNITITYDKGAYGDGFVLPTVAAPGSITLSNAKFSRTGYIQTHWTVKENDENAAKYLLGEAAEITANLTLYPVWKEQSYTVTFDPDGGQLAGGVQSIEALYNTFVLKPVVSKDGYYLSGWFIYSGLDAQNNIILGNEWNFETDKVLRNIILIAKWNIQSYNVVFDTAGGSATPATQSVEYGSKISEPSDPYYEGREFTGWYYSELKWDFDTYLMPYYDIILTAGWNQYAVSFNLNGGKGSPPFSQTVAQGGKVTPVPDPYRDGCTFTGWYAGGKAWDFSDSFVTSDVVLYARWNIEKPEVDIKNSEAENEIILIADVEILDGVDYTYQWYKEINGVWVLVSGATGKTLTLAFNDNGKYKCVVTASDNSEGGGSAFNEAQYYIPEPVKEQHLYWLIWLLLSIIVAQGIFLFFLIGNSAPQKNGPNKNKNGGAKRIKSYAFLPFISAVAKGEIAIVSIEAAVIIILGVCIIYFLPEKQKRNKDNKKSGKNDKQEQEKSVQESAEQVLNTDAALPGAEIVKIKPKIKSVEDFKEEETANIEEEIASERDPYEYIEKALQTANEINHITALNMLMQELKDEEERQKKDAKEDSATEAVQKDTENFFEDDAQEQEESEEEEKEESEEEILRREEAEKEAEKFKNAKKNGEEVSVPELKFTLSREDVLDYIENSSRHPDRYPLKMNVSLKRKNYNPDMIKCGELTFALMFEKKRVIKFVLRADEKIKTRLKEKYSAVYPGLYFNGEGLNFIVDSSVKSKEEAYQILDECYFCALDLNYKNNNFSSSPDSYSLKHYDDRLEYEISLNSKKEDEKYNVAIGEYSQALKKYRAKNIMRYKMTRARIIDFALKGLGENITVTEQPQKWYLPVSIKYDSKSFAMVYEKNGELILTVKISEESARLLALSHPQIRRARFPNGRNWYIVNIDGSFVNPQSIYRVLRNAKKFAEN